MDFDGFVYLPGNDYTRALCAGFLKALEARFGKPVIFVQLLENMAKKLPYSQLEPRAYSDYIERAIGRPGRYVLMGISMGCLHIANFARFHPEYCWRCLFMLEPTIMQGIYPLLHDYEAGRGNGEWLRELHERPEELDIPANERVMDIAVSPEYGRPPRMPRRLTVGVVYTSRSNTDAPYTPLQLRAKARYFQYLERSQKRAYLLQLHAMHCVDTQPALFDRVLAFVERVLRAAKA